MMSFQTAGVLGVKNTFVHELSERVELKMRACKSCPCRSESDLHEMLDLSSTPQSRVTDPIVDNHWLVLPSKSVRFADCEGSEHEYNQSCCSSIPHTPLPIPGTFTDHNRDLFSSSSASLVQHELERRLSFSAFGGSGSSAPAATATAAGVASSSSSSFAFFAAAAAAAAVASASAASAAAAAARRCLSSSSSASLAASLSQGWSNSAKWAGFFR
mmetsp:Transcript_94626/g.207079  ORF Transcript_94626/g.207079 Transcript_94626/m.207079 type:complete len:215 (-) Transcript_94626:1265-1909(-)